MGNLYLARHGQSTYNAERRYTGLHDAPLTPKGREDARHLAQQLAGVPIDIAYSSALRRATETLTIILEACHLTDIPQIHAVQLNECDHGGLQGLTRDEAIRRFGEDCVSAWRTRADATPPAGESLLRYVHRSWPFFEKTVLRDLRGGKNVLVIGHGRSLQGMMARCKGLPLDTALGIPMTHGTLHRIPVSALQTVTAALLP